MFKDTTSQGIATTKSFNFNKNNIVVKRSSTFYSSSVYSRQMTSSRENYEWDSELKQEFQNIINRLNNLRANQVEVIDILKRILDNDVSTKQEISTLSSNHELLNWTTCIDDNCFIHFSKKEKSEWYFKKIKSKSNDKLNECSHDIWRTCQQWDCAKHILKEVAKRKIKINHEVFDWSFCDVMNCSNHQESQNLATLSRIEKRYLWWQTLIIVSRKKLIFS